MSSIRNRNMLAYRTGRTLISLKCPQSKTYRLNLFSTIATVHNQIPPIGFRNHVPSATLPLPFFCCGRSISSDIHQLLVTFAFQLISFAIHSPPTGLFFNPVFTDFKKSRKPIKFLQMIFARLYACLFTPIISKFLVDRNSFALFINSCKPQHCIYISVFCRGFQCLYFLSD